MFEMASSKSRGGLAGTMSPETPQYDFSNTEPVARITLASPDKILGWSQHHSRSLDKRALEASPNPFGSSDFGEVKKPETINYRSFKPEKDGLFCERIFGPVKDWECACGKYKRIKYKGIICDRCGVEVTESKVRRVRMGHIKLAAPVSHIWFYKGTSSRISNLLDISVRDLGKVLYFQDYCVVEPGDSPLKEKQILTEEEARKYSEVYGDKVKIMIGAEAIKELLKKVEIDELYAELQQEMRDATSQQKRQKVIKRLKVVKAFRESHEHGNSNKPEWMILDILPVIPPDLRPLVHLDGGRFATSDLNDLYRRVINRNNRLKRLIELRAPDVILRNEKRMLQEAVDALFDNSRRSRPTKGHNNRPLKSLSDMLKGKQGRFRQNLLGKRVDYSGRSVIVVGPELGFSQCGLPKKMALELFDPFIIHELQKRGYCNTIKSAKKMMERGEPVVYDILEDVIEDHPVMLNRAPTLHRLGVQAFFPKLVEGKAIRLHPLACAAFNADFDGDQMAVHVPLSVEARLEAKLLMLAENNILSPANGKPIATPSQDIVLGCYYLTKVKRGAKGEGMLFASSEEVELAHSLGHVALHAEISVRVGDRLVKTTPGRVIFANILPPEVDYYDKSKYDFANEIMTKKNLGAIADVVYKASGAKKTAKMLDDMKKLGFEHAKRGGVSIAVDHMIIPPNKWDILEDAKKDVAKVQEDYERGVITFGERYNRVIDIWTHATDKVASELMDQLKASHDGFNPIYMMAFSGARGNEQQIRQLAGMRGLMQKPTKKLTGGIGEIIENPIQSNFREGLTVVEYFISTHGARKGLADTALKTSDAGYLTRRLVDVAQDLIVNEDDCGTVNGIVVGAIKEVTTQGERILQSLSERIDGRVACDPVIHPNTNKVIAERNELITEELATEIEDAGVEEVKIRSVLTCETRRGCCVLCYGRNLGTGHIIEKGEAVGVIAAQSIGEPGTQLTLRTFHIGGTASRQLEGWYEAAKAGYVKYKGGLKTVARDDGSFVVVNRTGKVVIEDEDGNELQILPTIPYGSTIAVADGDQVKAGAHFVQWQPHVTPIITEVSGKVKLIDLKPGATLREEVDLATNQRQRIVIEHKEELHPQIQIIGDSGDIVATYALSSGTILSQGLANGLKVSPGDVIARIPRAKTRSKDITGGLPRIDELFEARKPKDAAIIADIDGVVNFKGIAKGVRKLAIVGDNEEEATYSVPLVRHLTVRDGERVEAGMQLTDGSISPHDILRVKGEKAVQEFLLSEIQEVYRLQGVNINDKHIESIIRQMLKKVIVKEPGDTHFLFEQQVDRAVFQEENQRVIEKGGQPATAEPKLLGLTKASLETESFISAASFQETTRVLTDAAIRGRVDHLRGLKENVIMGLLIPAGTGLAVNRAHEIESVQDALAAEEQAQAAAAPVPTADLGPMTPIEDDDDLN